MDDARKAVENANHIFGLIRNLEGRRSDLLFTLSEVERSIANLLPEREDALDRLRDVLATVSI